MKPTENANRPRSKGDLGVSMSTAKGHDAWRELIVNGPLFERVTLHSSGHISRLTLSFFSKKVWHRKESLHLLNQQGLGFAIRSHEHRNSMTEFNYSIVSTGTIKSETFGWSNYRTNFNPKAEVSESFKSFRNRRKHEFLLYRYWTII